MNKSAPIKIDIQLEEPKSEAPPAAVQLRLVAAKPALTIEEISQKLERADAKRQSIAQSRSTAENRMSRQEKTRL